MSKLFLDLISQHKCGNIVWVGGNVVGQADGQSCAFAWGHFLIKAKSLHQGHKLVLSVFLRHAFLCHPCFPFQTFLDVEEEGLFCSIITLGSLLTKTVNFQLCVGVEVFHKFILVQVEEFCGRPKHFERVPFLWRCCCCNNCLTIFCASGNCSVFFRLFGGLLGGNLGQDLL